MNEGSVKRVILQMQKLEQSGKASEVQGQIRQENRKGRTKVKERKLGNALSPVTIVTKV